MLVQIINHENKPANVAKMDDPSLFNLIKQLIDLESKVRWAIADCLSALHTRNPKLTKMVPLYDVSKINAYIRVSRGVEPNQRNHSLSFEHHVEVLGLDKREQVRWLKRAVTDRMTVSQLRRAIRATKKQIKTSSESFTVPTWTKLSMELERELKRMKNNKTSPQMKAAVASQIERLNILTTS